MKLKIAENIRRLRREKDLTQEELADKLCVSLQVISRWETGVSYPDLELIPVIASLFGISTDQLIGADLATDGDAPQEIYDLVNSTSDHAKRLQLLKEVHRDYPQAHAFLWNLCLESDDLADKRKYTEELLSLDADGSYRCSAVNDLICHETDEALLTAFLQKHTTQDDMRRSVMLCNRYLTRNEYEKYEPLKQALALEALKDAVLPNLLPDFPPQADVSKSLYASRMRLEILNLLTGTSGKSTVAGDGVPDLWFGERLNIGIRYVCHLSGSGKTEEALTALEELTALCEAFFSLPDQTELTYRCPSFAALRAALTVQYLNGPYVGEDYTKKKHVVYQAVTTGQDGKEPDEFLYLRVWPCMAFNPFYAQSGWEWFDSIRENPRYLACLERLKAWDKTIEA